LQELSWQLTLCCFSDSAGDVPYKQAPLLKGKDCRLSSINFQGIFVSFRGSEIHLFTREKQIYEAMKLPENHSIESFARDFLGDRSHDIELVWAVLSEKQMSNK